MLVIVPVWIRSNDAFPEVLGCLRFIDSNIREDNLGLIGICLVQLQDLIDAQIRLAIGIVWSSIVKQPHVHRALAAIGANDEHVVLAFFAFKRILLLECMSPLYQVSHQCRHRRDLGHHAMVLAVRSFDNRFHLASFRVHSLHIVGANHVHHASGNVE